MKEFGMTPVLPAFAGTVPYEMKNLYPNSTFRFKNIWNGFGEETRTMYLEFVDPLFVKVGNLFIET